MQDLKKKKKSFKIINTRYLITAVVWGDFKCL